MRETLPLGLFGIGRARGVRGVGAVDEAEVCADEVEVCR